ncbi:MAG: M14 family zinc carboxypeptidase [Actinomycetota bacterium]
MRTVLLRRTGGLLIAAVLVLGLLAPAAQATPVCTDGYAGGLPLVACGGRVFPEAEHSVANIQLTPDATGFSEFVHGMEYLQQTHPRWISVFNLRDHYADDTAVSAGPDGRRSYEPGDTGDGRDIWVVKITDHDVPDEGKLGLAFSLSVHGDEIGGREGGARVAEDLVMMAENGGEIADGVPGYESTTGQEPVFASHEVADVLAQEVIYLMHFNTDGWVAGDNTALTDPDRGFLDGTLYTRGNAMGTDLNRQMPTVGRINPSRNPLQESEMAWGVRFLEEAAAISPGGRLAYGADIHGETQSRAWSDIMYPAGQFDTIKHRQLMAIAERTKSVIDATLFEGVPNFLEDQFFGGDAGEGLEDSLPTSAADNVVPIKPARWGTVWDTLGYTDTGFIGDYLAAELAVTGMDYEIALNHADARALGRAWSVVLQENYINATRAIVTTAMAYALQQDTEFADVTIETDGGRVGYVLDPNRVTDTDADGPGRLPGPSADGVGQDGQPVAQAPYSASQVDWFTDSSGYIENGAHELQSADIAADPAYLDQFDTIVMADLDLDRGVAPEDGLGRPFDADDYWANLRGWVERGGNLVLTDRALHGLTEMDVLDDGAVVDISTYMPYANFVDGAHPLAEGLRGNARQLAEFSLIGVGIGNNASPMSIVTTSAWEAAGGHVVATTGNNTGSSDDGTRTSIGELPLGDGVVRILGGGLHRPSEDQDHRFGLKDYALTYSGLYVLENALAWDAPGLGTGPATDDAAGGAGPVPGDSTGGGSLLLVVAPLGLLAAVSRRFGRS